MGTVNKVILVGRLGANPELSYTAAGRARCIMSLATNQNYTDKKGDKQEKVNWHRLVAWGKQGELCKDHLSKGRQIYIEGKLESRSYTDKEGAKRYISEVVTNNIVFLDSKGRAEGSMIGVGEPPFDEEQREELREELFASGLRIDENATSEQSAPGMLRRPALERPTVNEELPF